MTEIYLMFYQAALQSFMSFTLLLQREDPLLPFIFRQIINFLTRLARKFLTVASIRAAKDNISSLQFADVGSQKPGWYIRHKF